MYEMLVGYPPFCSETPHLTYLKIMSWSKDLQFPDEAQLSPSALDLISKLICDPNDRLGHNKNGGVEKMKAHPFLQHSIDFSNIRSMRAPFIPTLKSITDTSYFPTEELAHVSIPVDMGTQADSGGGVAKDLAFVGYTFKRFDDLTRRNAL